MEHSPAFYRGIIFPLFILFSFPIVAQQSPDNLQLQEVKKIWDKAPHNAFTDLICFQGQWFCVFREGETHISPDGSLRVITSENGKNWESAALITSKNSDLRDAKITVTPDEQLMLSGAAALANKSNHSHQSLAWFSDDGTNWGKAIPIGDPDYWLWRTTWHDGTAYNIGYACKKPHHVRLYTSRDGKNFHTHVKNLFDTGYPNETSLVFKKDTAFCLLRRDGPFPTGLIGISLPPYTKWEWKNLGIRIGGPHMILLPDGRLLATVRLYQDKAGRPVRTALCRIDPCRGNLTEILTLPSGGDTSYAGMVLHKGVLWISYYSSHEGKTAIYLAKVKVCKKRSF